MLMGKDTGRNTGSSRVQGWAPRRSIAVNNRAIAGLKRPNARIRRAIRRAFIIAGRPIVVSDVLPRAFPRHRGRYLRWQRWSCQRALMQEAQVLRWLVFGPLRRIGLRSSVHRVDESFRSFQRSADGLGTGRVAMTAIAPCN
jgi:hypothetical protein